MYLINVWTMQRELYLGDTHPPYIILSHRWQANEIRFEDYEQYITDLSKRPKKFGRDLLIKIKKPAPSQQVNNKIANACRLIRDNKALWRVNHLWIDTCCIDKRSAQELSRAINMMYDYYRQSKFCIVYLDDVGRDGMILAESKWFTRGWTLQELIAPPECQFYDMDWAMVGSRTSRAIDIAVRTGIDQKFLGNDVAIASAPVAVKMSWISDRRTTLIEDMAYCMLGLFGITIDLRYGEGHKAFQRLQQELISLRDASLYAWHFPQWVAKVYDGPYTWGLLAPWPVCFGHTIYVPPDEASNNAVSPRAVNNGTDAWLHHLRLPEATVSSTTRNVALPCQYALSDRCRPACTCARALGSRYQILLKRNKQGTWRRLCLPPGQTIDHADGVCFLNMYGAYRAGPEDIHVPHRMREEAAWDKLLANPSPRNRSMRTETAPMLSLMGQSLRSPLGAPYLRDSPTIQEPRPAKETAVRWRWNTLVSPTTVFVQAWLLSALIAKFCRALRLRTLIGLLIVAKTLLRGAPIPSYLLLYTRYANTLVMSVITATLATRLVLDTFSALDLAASFAATCYILAGQPFPQAVRKPFGHISNPAVGISIVVAVVASFL